MSTTPAVEPAEVTTITQPGLVYGMPDSDYHGDPIPGGSLSSTFARLLTEHVPAKADAIRRNRKPTRAMNLGKAAHRRALGTGPDLIVWQHIGTTKAGKAERAEYAEAIAAESVIAVTQAEHEQVESMATALRAHSEIAHILDNGHSEVSGFWQENGIWCRARFDHLGEYAWDYKSTKDVTLRAFAGSVAKYGYHQQADFYRRCLIALGIPAGQRPFRFICQETEEPYLVQIHEVDDEALEVAAALNDRAIGLFAEAQRTGKWAGYESLYAKKLSLPGYYFFDHADVLPDHWNPSVEMDISL